jgi:phage shock protein E
MIIMIVGFISTTFADDAVKPIIIDVRTVREWNNSHLDGTILISFDQIDEKIGNVTKDKSQRIYVYCRTGHRARIAKETLEKLGYKDVVNLGSLENAAKTMNQNIVK